MNGAMDLAQDPCDGIPAANEFLLDKVQTSRFNFGKENAAMILKTVFIRFYRSFNYDYLRKHHRAAAAKAKPWEYIENAFYPYVRVPLHEKVTTVVGANESGKSHLLTAIEKGISGVGIQSHDFCRYSHYFTVTKGEMRKPDFGFEWGHLSGAERTAVRDACGIDPSVEFDSFFTFRTGPAALDVYLATGDNHLQFSVQEDKIAALIPKTFRINADVALPDSVPIRELTRRTAGAGEFGFLDRSQRFGAVEGLCEVLAHPEWYASQQAAAQSAASLSAALGKYATASAQSRSLTPDRQRLREAQFSLARDLICKVAKIDEAAIQDLYEALKKGNEGHANGIIDKINKNLEARLNFPRVWVQDRSFALMVSPREHDLVFTVRDRTNTEYSFAERSSGLKYFLSYYIQYLSHESSARGTEILLMDEPDAYLSSQAQQDLLKIFRSFSEPEPGRDPVQVIYVTHSPFLIDKNNADRIRVLEKGSGDEGSRVVKNAGRNHYEPLRSAFGAFLAETTFIGNCNLMVEGVADQVLLGGATAHLRARGRHDSETLDLNRITIVPVGSASHVPYLVYLARGRDIERPPLIVLLDSDAEGNKAVRELARGGPRSKELLKSEFVFQIGRIALPDLPSPAIELEDLLPLEMCVRAARRYAKEYWGADPETIGKITASAVESHRPDGTKQFDAICRLASTLPGQPHIDKIGFARAVVDSLPPVQREGSLPPGAPSDVEVFERNMLALLKVLRQMQRLAEREQASTKISEKVERLKSKFVQDYRNGAPREQGTFLLEEIEAALDDTSESDLARNELNRLRRDFHLADEPFAQIPEFEKFLVGLEKIKYVGVVASAGQNSSAGEQTGTVSHGVSGASAQTPTSSQQLTEATIKPAGSFATPPAQ